MKKRELQFEDFSEVATDMKNLHEKGYQKVGSWELNQICDHLAKSTDVILSAKRSQFAVPLMIRLLKPFLRRMILPSIERGVPLKRYIRINAPESLQPPSVDCDFKIVFEKFQEGSRQLQLGTGDLMEEHPVFGKFTREQWVKFALWHAAHHLRFLIPNE